MTDWKAPPAEVLLVEDDLADMEFTRKAIEETKLPINLRVARAGDEALAFLRRESPHTEVPRPDLILLDWDLPRMGGRELLAVLKADENLKIIPVIVMTTSALDRNVLESYRLHANADIAKPLALSALIEVMRAIQSFWFGVATLPPRT